jgi:hypothetical protein
VRLEELEKLGKRELRDRINLCFEEAEQPGTQRGPLYSRAQFYMRELEHRRDSWVSIRDFVLEIVVIVLIVWEIGVGYSQERQQDKAFEKEQKILSSMETSSAATAQTLGSLATTTFAMNRALQKQLALFYEVSVTPIWDASTKKITIVNTGRTNIAVWGTKFSDYPALMWDSRVISPMGTYIVTAGYIYDGLLERVPKGAGQFVPYDLYIKNDKGEEFVEHCEIGTSWTNDDLILGMQVVSVEPEHWSKDIKKSQAR